MCADEKIQPYQDTVEHLSDLLQRLDLRIAGNVVLHRERTAKAETWAGFVAITDKEVDELLSHATGKALSTETDSERTEIKTRLAQLNALIERRVRASLESGIFLPLVEIIRIFGLSDIEVDALTVCLGPEVDRRYERLYGYLQDDMTRRLPSIGLLLALCSGSSGDEIHLRRIFSACAPMIKYQLLHIVDESTGMNPFMSKPVGIDSRIASFLLGEPGFDTRLQEKVEWVSPRTSPSIPVELQEPLIDQLVAIVNECLGDRRNPEKPLFYLYGKPRTGKHAVVREVSRRLRLPLLMVDVEQLDAGPVGLEEGMFLAFRENLLCQSVICLQHVDRILNRDNNRLRLKSLTQYIREMGGITFLTGEAPWSWRVPRDRVTFLPFALQFPDYAEQVEMWKTVLKCGNELDEKDLSSIVSKYPSSLGQIVDAATMARTHAALKGSGEGVTLADIDQGCRATRTPDLGHLAQKVDPKYTWEDIILPPGQLDQLREICNHVVYRSIVYGRWGFGRKLSLGKGLHALFSGSPGTGKTMAAEVIANELHLDLFKIDLSQIVSKYIGETEKNLHQIFREAEQSHAILFFDEADALLGKRSDVKDAHDRYANIEIAYLLQKMEEYEGVTILATNLRQNMDEAFSRRIRFVVEFPFPESEYRLRIWQGIWPKETPLHEDVDLGLLACKFKLTGGSIRNIAIAAAFSASSNGKLIEMKHLLTATKQEFQKMGRLVDEGKYAHPG